MEKLQYFILLCFGFLLVYNFLRDMEVKNRFDEMETRHQGNLLFYSVFVIARIPVPILCPKNSRKVGKKGIKELSLDSRLFLSSTIFAGHLYLDVQQSANLI